MADATAVISEVRVPRESCIDKHGRLRRPPLEIFRSDGAQINKWTRTAPGIKRVTLRPSIIKERPTAHSQAAAQVPVSRIRQCKHLAGTFTSSAPVLGYGRKSTNTFGANLHGSTCAPTADTFLFPTATSFSSEAPVRSKLLASSSNTSPHLLTFRSRASSRHHVLP